MFAHSWQQPAHLPLPVQGNIVAMNIVGIFEQEFFTNLSVEMRKNCQGLFVQPETGEVMRISRKFSFRAPREMPELAALRQKRDAERLKGGVRCKRLVRRPSFFLYGIQCC